MIKNKIESKKIRVKSLMNLPQKFSKIDIQKEKKSENNLEIFYSPKIKLPSIKKLKSLNFIENKVKSLDEEKLSLKLKIHIENLQKINFSNGIYVKEMSNYHHNFRYCVIAGNNPFMIKNVLRNRWWWSSIENFDENFLNINFLWSEYPNQKFLNVLEEKVNKNNMDYNFNTNTNEIINDKKLNIINTNNHLKKLINSNDKNLIDRVNEMSEKNIKKLKENISIIDLKKIIRIYSHLEFSFNLGDKKYLFNNLKEYFENINDDVFNYIPLTFHIKEGIKDEEYQKFIELFEKEKSIWIIKPGENTNKGKGITITCDLAVINEILETAKISDNGFKRTFIIQKYIEKPLLFNKRKFDIRCFFLVTSINGMLKGNFF